MGIYTHVRVPKIIGFTSSLNRIFAGACQVNSYLLHGIKFRRWICTLLCGLSLSVASALSPRLDLMISSAAAQNSVDEDQVFAKMISKASEAFQEHRYQEAIAHYESALVLKDNPNIHWNLSVCYYKLKIHRKALFHANQYLELGSPPPKIREKVEARRAELLRALERGLDDQGTPSSTPSVSPLSSPPATVAQTPVQTQEQDPVVESAPAPGASSRTKSIIWSLVAVGGFGIGSGIHLYADSLWASRPAGGGVEALDVRRDALYISGVGDIFLVLGLTSIVVASVYFFSDDEESTDDRGVELQSEVWGRPTIKPLVSSGGQEDGEVSVKGALFGWHLKF